VKSTPTIRYEDPKKEEPKPGTGFDPYQVLKSNDGNTSYQVQPDGSFRRRNPKLHKKRRLGKM